jgi:hypothetical protein
MEVTREQDDLRSIWAHPIWQRALMGEPAANKLAARIDGAAIVMSAMMPRTEFAFLTRLDGFAIDCDLQPAVATGGTKPAVPALFPFDMV